MQILPSIHNEYGSLQAVVVGRADALGPAPTLDQCYDARSYESVQTGSYPSQQDCRREIEHFAAALAQHGVTVYRPAQLPNLNQIFSRDVGFVIDDQFVLPNVIEDRSEEQHAYDAIIDLIPSSQIIMMPSGCHAEGGDVLVHNNYVFVGVANDEDFERYQTARTNIAGFEYLQDEFPQFEFKGFELHKDDHDPHAGSLHLDCAFQPVGSGALICPKLFKHAEDVDFLKSLFGPENCFECTPEEAYMLTTNVFSISASKVVIPSYALRLKQWLEERGSEVITVDYDHIVQMGGLLRCSTMPLIRG